MDHVLETVHCHPGLGHPSPAAPKRQSGCTGELLSLPFPQLPLRWAPSHNAVTASGVKMRTSGTKSHIHMPAHKHTTLLHFFLFLTYFHLEGSTQKTWLVKLNFLGLSNWMFTCGPEKWHPLKPCDASLGGTCMCCFLKCKFIFVTVIHREYVCTCIFERDKKKERRCQVKYVRVWPLYEKLWLFFYLFWLPREFKAIILSRC